jgi:hypothetical protein
MGMIFGGAEIVILLAVFLFALTFGAAFFAFWIWMLIDCIRNENISGNERVAWVLVIALTHWLGALIYFFAGRTRRPARMPPPMPATG